MALVSSSMPVPLQTTRSIQMSAEQEEKVCVAVAEEVKEGKANLLWALQNISKDQKIVIVHVHRPWPKNSLGARFPATQLKELELKAYRQFEREKMNKSLDDYLDICSRVKVQAEKLVIEMDDIGEGLIELIAQHRISKLVMGAAADRYYSRKMKVLLSKIALSIKQLADPSCKVWFVCKGNLICTRDTFLYESGMTRSATSTRSFNTSQSLQASENDCGISAIHGHLENAAIDDKMKEKLDQALREAERLKHEAYEEARRRQETERHLFQALQQVKESENLYTKVMKQRKEIEEILAIEKVELEKLRKHRDEVFNELKEERQQKLRLKLCVADSDCPAKELLLEHDTIRFAGEKEEQITNNYRTMNFAEFSFSELQQATNNFDESLKIGEGRYGKVFKGFLRHTVVAIKLLNHPRMQREFNQQVNVLSKMRHPNLVMLIGACPEACALIYELLPNGSLEDHLSCKDTTMPLTWKSRIGIAADICSALIFLHSNKPRSTIHGDLKPANILLDANFVGKLGDYGNCRCVNECNATTTLYRQTHPKGTFVYIDPEFLISGDLRPQSDVYSFGIIILRLLTGRSALGLASDVHESLEKGCLQAMLDPSAGDWPLLQAEHLARLGLRCCEIRRKNRPDLAGEVWQVLNFMRNSFLSSSSNSLPLQSVLEDPSCIPSYFICPILKEIMRDPHVAADGFTYEGEAIKEWFDAGHDTSPMTNLELLHCDLVPNHALRSAIQQWLQQHR